ncbi:unnamed protein product [Caenorhabditis nigoni]
MSVTLAYRAMGPILEFMEANKRIRLTSRCPSLDAIDKSTPLRLDILEFRTNCIQINKMSYELLHCDQQYVENPSQKEDKSSREALAPGDIQMDGNAFPTFRNFVAFRIQNGLGRESVRRLPANLEIHVALKKLSSYLLGGRTAPIKVAEELILDLEQGYILRLPENLKIWVKYLNTMRSNFEDILPILDPSCFPLETLKLENARLHNLQNPGFRTARNVEILGIHGSDEERNQFYKWCLEFQQLPNKNIFMEHQWYRGWVLVNLIKYWMEYGKEIGTCWSFGRSQSKNARDLMLEIRDIKDKIGGTYRKAAIGYALVLPISEASELMIVEVKMPEDQRRALQLVVQQHKIDRRSSFKDRIMEHVYTYWMTYAFLAHLTLCGPLLLLSILGPNSFLSVPWIVGLITISFSFVWFILFPAANT